MGIFVTYPDPVLSKVAVARPVDDAMRAAGVALQAAATEVQAYGLAAAHMGRLEPLVVVSLAGAGETRDYRVLYNPKILDSAATGSPGPEGSVSMPGIEVPIERAEWVQIGFDDVAGMSQTLRLDGFAARVAQHEIDQLEGIFFLNRLSRLKRDTAIRKFHKSQR